MNTYHYIINIRESNILKRKKNLNIVKNYLFLFFLSNIKNYFPNILNYK